MKKLNRLFYTLLFLFYFISIQGCKSPKDPSYNQSFMTFGTMVNVTITNESYKTASEAIDLLEQDFSKLHQQWHAWHTSTLTEINQKIAHSEPAEIPTKMLPLIKKGIELNQLSNQLFNPAIGKLIDLWGFHDDTQRVKQPPTPGAISYLLKQAPSMSDLHLTGHILTSDNPNVQLDFGAYGKGYGIQLALERLHKLGIDNALIEAGGDVSAVGSRGGRPWRIAVRNPNKAGVFATADLYHNESIFTSGNYERKFVYKGTTYHHVIDPRTGYPSIGATSVTVIHPDPTIADAAATALLIAGPNEWHKIAKKMGIKYVALLDDEGTLHLNPAMKKRLTIIKRKMKVKISEPLFFEKKMIR